MNIHEYQAKELLKRYGVAVLDGYVAWTPDEAVAAARKLPGPVYVVKSQIHAGGRGAGRFADDPNGKGGVRLARSPDEVRAAAEAMLGHTLVTKQTGAARPPGAPRLCRGRLRHRPRALSLAAGRPRHRPRHHGRLHRRRHGDRGSRGARIRRRSCASRSIRPPAFPASMRGELAFGLGLTGKQVAAFGKFAAGAVHAPSPASTARSSRSTRWSSPAPARWSRSMPRSASTTTRCSAIPSWRSCATRPRKTRRSSKPPSTT